MTATFGNRRQFVSTSMAAGLGFVSRKVAWSEEPQNELIHAARGQALEVLKPTKQDLQHGLELHKNSVVFDAYAFAPRAALDGDAMARAVSAGASAIELDDMREDMNMTRAATNAKERKEFQDVW